MKIVYYMLFASLMFLSSCGKKSIADEILKMQSRPIDMASCEGAVCYENGERAAYYSNADSAYKLIIYIDSASCSPCFVSHMLDYMGAVVDLDSVGVNTLFIFESKQEQKENLESSLAQLAYPLRAIVVPNGSFSSVNPHLPSSTLLHSFLLDKENKVIVVGNPARNDKVKELMLNTVRNRE